MNRFLTLCFLVMNVHQPITAQKLIWKQTPSLPDPVGFAGSYAGISNGTLLVAGGANFPDNVGPWGKAKKTWYDEVYALESVAGPWKQVGKLPHKMGYGVSITVPNGVLCIGGADGNQHYETVFLLSYQTGKLTSHALPSLPYPLANACGAFLNGSVYVAGGLSAPNDTTTQRIFLRLDYQQPDAQWEALESWPGSGRMLAVAGTDKQRFFLFSGTDVARDGVTGAINRRYLTDAFAYDPSTKRWKTLATLPHAVVAAPSPAWLAGTHQLLVLGGDDGEKADKNAVLKETHPGFRTDILSYNSLVDTWTVVDYIHTSIRVDAPAYPERSQWAPVTTPLVNWNNTIILPGGEVRPGVRTTRILRAIPTLP